MRKLALLLPLVIMVSALVTACGTFQSHRLPMSAMQAPQSFAPIAACADERGLMVSEHEDSIHVKIDETAWVQFMIQIDAYNMVLIVDDKIVPPSEIEAKFTAVKATGDEIFQCAIDHMKNLSGTTASAPAPVAIPEGVTGTCAKLFACYGALANTLCDTSAGADCKASFEVKIEGNDDEGCSEVLAQVPELVEPFKMSKPDFVIPAQCE